MVHGKRHREFDHAVHGPWLSAENNEELVCVSNWL